MLNLHPPRSGKLRPLILKKVPKPLPLKYTIDCEKTQNINQPKTVETFLKELGLLKFISNFINNGIDNIEKLAFVNNDHLKMINIPYASRVKILKKIKEENLNTFEKNKSKINTDVYEEILCPAEEDDIIINEEDQRKTFSNAISAFQKEQKEKIKTIIKEEPIQKSEIGIGDDNINKEIENQIYYANLEDVGEYKEKIYEGKDNKKEVNKINFKDTPSTPLKNYPIEKKKTYCYQCLHIILEEHCIVKYEKPFCSIHCVELYDKKNIRICSECKKKIQIISSISSKDNPSKHFCSVNCLNKNRNNEKINKTKDTKNKTNEANINKSSSSDSIGMIDILDL